MFFSEPEMIIAPDAATKQPPRPKSFFLLFVFLPVLSFSCKELSLSLRFCHRPARDLLILIKRGGWANIDRIFPAKPFWPRLREKNRVRMCCEFDPRADWGIKNFGGYYENFWTDFSSIPASGTGNRFGQR
jgi:hypothetical protein